jgi:hypothetical protein
MRIHGFVLTLAFVVVGMFPAGSQAQNQLQVGKDFNLATRKVNEHWLKVDYEPRDSRRGDPGDVLPPGLDRDVDTAVVGGSTTNNPVDPGNEMRVNTRKAGDFQFDVKQSGSKTTGGLPPGIERDTDASGAAVRNNQDLLGADRRVRTRPDDEARKPILRPAIDRSSPAAMRAEPRSTPRENALRGLRGYKANRWE